MFHLVSPSPTCLIQPTLYPIFILTLCNFTSNLYIYSHTPSLPTSRDSSSVPPACPTGPTCLPNACPTCLLHLPHRLVPPATPACLTWTTFLYYLPHLPLLLVPPVPPACPMLVPPACCTCHTCFSYCPTCLSHLPHLLVPPAPPAHPSCITFPTCLSQLPLLVAEPARPTCPTCLTCLSHHCSADTSGSLVMTARIIFAMATTSGCSMTTK